MQMSKTKRVCAAAIAAVLGATTILTYGSAYMTAFAADRYEFEDGDTNADVLSDVSDASGGEYVFLDDSSEYASVTVEVSTSDTYSITIGVVSQYGDKVASWSVNGESQGTFNTGTDDVAAIEVGTAYLEAGENTITVEPSWTWFGVDYVEIDTADLADVTASDTTCCDEDATDEAQELMGFLSSVYGSYVISGQQEYYGTSRSDEFDYIYENTGELPVIRGFDFGNTCPLYAWDDGTNDRIIAWVQGGTVNDVDYSEYGGGIAEATWHINVPTSMDDLTYTVTEDASNPTGYSVTVSSIDWSNTTYTEETDFSAANVMVEGTDEYYYFLACVDNLANELLEIQDEGVALLFRPFHEAEGGGGEDGSGAWFWWGCEGAETYVELYQYLYTLLTDVYGIHNLVWEFNSYTYDSSTSYYPGDAYVDIIGYDKYNCDGTEPNESAIASTFFELIEMYPDAAGEGGAKMIAMMENDTIPSAENMEQTGATWLYFLTWYDYFINNENYNDVDTLAETYQSELVITLSEYQELLAEYLETGDVEEPEEDVFDSDEDTDTDTDVDTDTGTDNETGTESDTDTGDTESATITDEGTYYTISFDSSMGEAVYLVLEADGVTYTNGCVGISVSLDGVDYWVSFYIEVTDFTEDYEVALTEDNVYNITYNNGSDEVTDDDLIAEIVALAQEATSAQVQIWWANDDSGSSVDTDEVVLVDAYILTESETEEEETEPETEEETEPETEEETEPETEEETEPETEEEPESEDEDTDLTLYGDVNGDGTVNLVDSVLLSKYIAGSIDLADIQSANADVNADDSVDSSDASILLQFQVGTVTALPYTD